MFEILYPFSYFFSLSALLLWSQFKNNPKQSAFMRKFLMAILSVYLLSLLFAPGIFTTKIFALSRDLVVMGLVSALFSLLIKKQSVFYLSFAITSLAFLIFGKPYMLSTFVINDKDNSDIELTEDGELLIEINQDNNIADISSLMSKYELEYQRAFFPERENETDLDDYFIIDIPAKHSGQINEIIEALSATQVVEWVETNEVFKVNPFPGKILKSKKNIYGINDPNVNQLWAFKVMEINKLYSLLKDQKAIPAKKAKICIVDSGIDAKHEDLKDRYLSIHADYDFDNNGHGTHCAGIAGAITNNGIGIASVFPENDYATISGIKVMNSLGLITQQRLIQGIIEAVDNGADVISVSIGGRSNDVSQKAFQKVVTYADKKNAVIVVAAGNSNSDANYFTPANASGVITVSAVDTLINKASFSNHVGKLKMGIAAPGVNIYATFPGNQYKGLSGTSMACPQVSGLVGLMKSIQPELTTSQIYEILKSTGKETTDASNTGMLIQPAKAIEAILE